MFHHHWVSVLTPEKTMLITQIILISSLLIFSINGIFASTLGKTTSIGAIIDDGSRIGKEGKAAMRVAARNFNSYSMNHKVSLVFNNHGGNPLQAAYAGEFSSLLYLYIK